MSSDTLTFDMSPPRRPTLEDCGGGQKVNGTPPPDPVRMLVAEDVNQLSKQAVATGSMIPLVTLFVRFTAGAPAIVGLMCPSGNVEISDFTLIDNGAGDTTITWPVGLLPTRAGNGGPRIFQIDLTEIDRIRGEYLTTLGGLPAVHCQTLLGAVGTDAAIGIDIL